MTRIFLAFLCALWIASTSLPAAAEDSEEQAIKAAESWLVLVDRGEYDNSWKEAATLFRAAVTPEAWSRSLKAVREPLGALVVRNVASSRYATTLPGAPDGEYVIIQFSTRFANKQSAIETVTPMKEPDGAWRVSGYFIR